jgi:Tol biopolymer transport system component
MVNRRGGLYALVLGFLGLVLGLLVVGWFGRPVVTGFSPSIEAGEFAPASSLVTVSFSQPMDRASVESRLSIEPIVAGNFTWQDDTLSFRPSTAWPQGQTVVVRLASGARSARGLPLLSGLKWSFAVGAPRIVYLWPADGPADLFVRSLSGEDSTRLTTTELGVYDYCVSGDRTSLTYTAERPDGGTDLRLLDLPTLQDRLVYACPEAHRCRAPAMSADGNWLAFEQVEIRPGPGDDWLPGPSRVWAVSLTQEEPAFPIAPADHVSSAPSWSPQGWLAYYDNTRKAIALIDLVAGEIPTPSGYLPTELGDIGSWSPDGQYLVFPEIIFTSDEDGDEERTSFYSHLFRTDLSTGVQTDLSVLRAGLVEDASPAYSPDGRWIAFARRSLEPGRWTLGRQVWRMRSDGTGARSLTDDPDYGHSAISWSPDSGFLVFMRFYQSDLTRSAEIWVMDVDGDTPRRLAEGGYLPQWIP